MRNVSSPAGTSSATHEPGSLGPGQFAQLPADFIERAAHDLRASPPEDSKPQLSIEGRQIRGSQPPRLSFLQHHTHDTRSALDLVLERHPVPVQVNRSWNGIEPAADLTGNQRRRIEREGATQARISAIDLAKQLRDTT